MFISIFFELNYVGVVVVVVVMKNDIFIEKTYRNIITYTYNRIEMSESNETKMLINNVQEESTTSSEFEFENWDDLDIEPNLLRGIYAYGFEKPSAIQKKAIKPIIMNRDIIAQAQSGTGKTATFTIGALSRINLDEKSTQVLILSPTRELSKQTATVAQNLGAIMEGLKIRILVGGNSTDDDVCGLKTDIPHIITGCPGRVYDMMRRNAITSRKIKLVILDEADEMFSNGFKEQVYNIFQYLSNNVQVALFSATIPQSMYSITEQLMRNPVSISVKAEQLTLECIAQYLIGVEDDMQKYATLKDLYNVIPMSQCFIYCNNSKRVNDLYEAMMEDGFPVCRIHSGMEKLEREHAFSEFRKGKYRVMISSNITARGIDVQQVNVVINFDLPKCVHSYLHRIGRGGRWGRKGIAINLITQRDIQKIKEIEQHYGCEILEMPSQMDKLFR